MGEKIPNNRFTLKDAFISMAEWWRYMLTKWVIIVVFGLVGGGIGLTLGFLSKPVYTANLSFVMEEGSDDGGFGGALSLASQFGFDLGGSGGGMFASANLLELFRSRNMIERTLLLPAAPGDTKKSFAETFIDAEGWREKWAQKPHLKDVKFLPNADRAAFSRTQDSIMGAIYTIIIKTRLVVTQKDKKTDIVNIELLSPNEAFAKYFTEALVKEVSVFYIDTKTKKAKANMEIVQQQTDSIRGVLNGSITDVAVAGDNTFALNPALTVKRTPGTRRQIDMQYNAAILTELVKQTELARVALRKETPLIQVIDKPIMPLKKDKLGKLIGLVVGGILGGLLIVSILTFRRMYRRMLS